MAAEPIRLLRARLVHEWGAVKCNLGDAHRAAAVHGGRVEVADVELEPTGHERLGPWRPADGLGDLAGELRSRMAVALADAGVGADQIERYLDGFDRDIMSWLLDVAGVR